MHACLNRLSGPRAILALVPAIALGAATLAQGAILTYTTTLSGAAEAPPNASPGTGTSTVTIDNVANTMRVVINFSGLLGNTTACHIHGPTAAAGTGTAGVATPTPTFPGFPSGVTAGSYDVTFDMTLATSYNAAFLTARGGNIALARADLFAAINDGKAYVNIHSNVFGGGEIRGFLTPAQVPVDASTWGRVKSLFN